MNKAILYIAVAVLFTVVQSATPDQWRSRTIYQIVTDRFALSSSQTTPTFATQSQSSSAEFAINDNANNTIKQPPTPNCASQETYCGGTFRGIIDHLDYITGMGFDAIWISPVVANIANCYHGYAAQNLYEINPNFGGADDLAALIDACHARGMYVMVGVVGNHMGIPPNYDYSQLFPFNDASHFHDCSSCPSNCWIQDYSNQQQVEICRLDGLPDLNQNNQFVRSTLKSWVSQLVQNFSIDGIRIDTVAEVHPDFWGEFQPAAGVYGVGEVFNGDINYVAPYQSYVNGLLSYPLYFTMLNVFAHQQSMNQLQASVQSYSAFKDIGLLGTFVDNHDNPRFLSLTGDTQRYKAALTYALLSTGIPIVYYGTEQLYSGSNTPDNRLPLWLSGFQTNTDMYKFLTTVINYRKKSQIYNNAQVQRYSDDTFYAFTRGDTFVALTNVGSGGQTVSRTITYQPWPNNTKLCNLFNTNDCISVQNGQFGITLQNGETKIYYRFS